MTDTATDGVSLEVFIPALLKRVDKFPDDLEAFEKLIQMARKVGDLDLSASVVSRLPESQELDASLIRLKEVLNQQTLSKPTDFSAEQVCPFAVFDDFLSEDEMNYVLQFVLERKSKFKQASYDGKDENGQVVRKVDKSYRDQFTFQPDKEIISFFRERKERVQYTTADQFGIKAKEVVHTNMNVIATVNGHGNAHSDRKVDSIYPMGDLIIFLYFINSEPRGFKGGDLLLHDTDFGKGVTGANYTRIKYQSNRLVAFPACFFHEVTKVDTPTNAIENSRFSIPFWVQFK